MINPYPTQRLLLKANQKQSDDILKVLFRFIIILSIAIAWFIALDLNQAQTKAWVVENAPVYGSPI